MEPTDPHEGQTYIFRSVNLDGTVSEVEMTAAQALDVASGRAVSWWPRDERIVVEDDGTIVHRESAVPDSTPAA